ncbi:hydroxymethylbilane synthase [Pollutimonas thiosulfatoxidans]|uniref:Porphobilinogen deaminase n=1 Tax=Pollutimonas thiosulfatoxidans TaxID=2028345 RepID=A0A410GGS9_9BURK|nr:hydroxymethylbilane synthase [Pollutimonas thiosulfatoxidans]MBF6615418.1 hydroxymethylbilane synthase [Candidimonas sp.]NYT45875.1 hydroxymethylbilane synthase [Alcaligenaceae bacterium]QAA95507.1 hydroxymethylbilane synthase [Pollutimonas thiosulfatoxidans]
MLASPTRLVIATRASRLALWQAEHVRDRLQSLYPGCEVVLLEMTTRGDQILDRSLSKVGGKGLFIKELETALLDGRADLAVHSLKDVPVDMQSPFLLSAILERDDPRDAFVSNDFASLTDLPAGSVVGTSSLRREAQIRQQFPQLVVQPLRGNLDTRLGKLDRGEYAAIILAAAGLRRLGLASRIRSFLEVEQSLPAAGQGALGIEILESRPEMHQWLAPLQHADTAACALAERAVSRVLGGSCQVPLAAFAQVQGDTIRIRALVGEPDGSRMLHAEVAGNVSHAEQLGEGAAQQLLDQGAQAILAKLLSAGTDA